MTVNKEVSLKAIEAVRISEELKNHPNQAAVALKELVEETPNGVTGLVFGLIEIATNLAKKNAMDNNMTFEVVLLATEDAMVKKFG